MADCLLSGFLLLRVQRGAGAISTLLKVLLNRFLVDKISIRGDEVRRTLPLPLPLPPPGETAGLS